MPPRELNPRVQRAEPGDGDPDAAALARVARGDRDAFEVLVDRHQDSIYRLARAAGLTETEAEDAWQETFLSIWRRAGDFRGDGPARAWIFTIARHAAWKIGARRAARADREDDEEDVELLGLEAGWGLETPESEAVRAEQARHLERALAALAPADREILVLRDLEGFSGEETARILGIGLRAMKSRLHRARLRLAAEVRRRTDHAP